MREDGGRDALPAMDDDEAEAFMQAERDKLAEERAYFDAHRDEWLREHADQFVLVKSRGVHGFFPSFEDAYERGERLFGDAGAMLIKRIAQAEDVLSISPGLLHGNLVVVE